MDNTTIEWLKANGFEKNEIPNKWKDKEEEDEERYVKWDKLSRNLFICTDVRETRELEQIFQRTNHPYVVVIYLDTPYFMDCKLESKVYFDGTLEWLKKALKGCEASFWKKAARYAKVLMVAGALHDGYKWINR